MEKICKNCEHHFEGQYCPNCGQKFIDQRLTLKESINWALNSIFNLDRGFLYTSLAVLRKPGTVIKDMLNGITIRYSHPFRFIFIWASLAAIFGVAAGTYSDTSIAVNEAMGVNEEQLKNTKKIQETIGSYMSFIIMAMIPFYSLGSYWLFKSKRFNYAEHLVINSYAFGSSTMLGIPFMIAYLFFPQLSFLNYSGFIIGLIIISRAYAQVFDTNVFTATAKYLLSFIMSLIMSIIFGIIIMIIVLICMKLLGMENPFKPA